MNNDTVTGLINNYDIKRNMFINDLNNTNFIINLETDSLRRNYIIKLWKNII